jgi:hypothetical protein
MAKPFGVDFENECIASVFATCVSCFDYAINVKANDAEVLRLSVIRLRLTRWGEAVDIYGDSRLGHANPDPDDLDVVKCTLVNMIALFESQAGSMEDLGDPADPATLTEPTDRGRLVQALLLVLEAIASKRAKGISLLDPRSLSLGRCSTQLVTASSEYIDGLEDYFPAAQRQRMLCDYERLEIEGKVPIEILEEAAIGIDHWLTKNRVSYTGVVNCGLALGNYVVGPKITFPVTVEAATGPDKPANSSGRMVHYKSMHLQR